MNPIQGHLVYFVKIFRCISYFYDERGSSITIIVENLSPVPSYHVNIFVFVFDPIVGLCIMASQFWHPPLFTERINRLCLPGWRRRLVCHFSFSEIFMKSKGWFAIYHLKKFHEIKRLVCHFLSYDNFMKSKDSLKRFQFSPLYGILLIYSFTKLCLCSE